MIEDFRFQSNNYLWLLLLMPILAWLTYLWFEKTRSRIIQFAPRNYFFQKNIPVTTILRFLALFCFIIAVARPQGNPTLEEREEQSLDIIVLLDVSKSMAAEDIYPNRLQKAKRSIQTFLTGLHGDRVGLVAFAGSAILVSPLTSDYEIIKNFLTAITVETIENQGTNIAAALQTAIDAFQRGALKSLAEDTKSHVIILLSDGEMTTGETKEGIQLLKEKNIIFYSVAVGEEKGVPIPLRDKEGTLLSYKRDPLGNTVLSKTDRKNMSNIAKEAGGVTYLSSMNDSEIYSILDDLNKLNRTGTKTNKNKIYSEYYFIPLAIGFLCLLFSYFIQNFPLTRAANIKIIIILFSLLNTFSTLSIASTSEKILFDSDKQKSDLAIKNFSEQKYEQSSDIYKSLLANDPNSPILSFNTATSLLKEGKKDQATSLLQEQKNFAPSAFNLAGALAEEKKYKESINEYASLIQNLSKKKNRTELEEKILEQSKKNIEFIFKKQEQEKKQDQKNEDKDKQEQDKQKEGGKGNEDKNKNNKNNPEKSKEQDKKEDQKNDEKKENEQNSKEQSQQKYDTQKRKKFKENETLSEQDAKQILEALKQQEQLLQKKFLYKREGESKHPNTSGKDW